MGLISFKRNFEIEVNHSQEAAFNKLLGYLLSNKKFYNVHFIRSESIIFKRRIFRFSCSTFFDVTLKAIDNKQTLLVVRTTSGIVNWCKAKRIVKGIVKEIY